VRPHAGQASRRVAAGTQWSGQLAEALGPSKELLEKSLRFSELYPREDVRTLQRMRVNWTRLYFSFAVSDADDRHALLRQAVEGNWTDQQLRFTIQQRFPSKRRGVGGRPRREPTSHGPEVALRELGRRCQSLTGYYRAAWSKVKKKEWAQLVQKWPAAEKGKLHDLLSDTDTAVEAVAEVCAQIRHVLARLLQETAQ